ncbi:hypothetical protein H8356DRAFT_1421554 [Neocallimastix lanati (nom. inval.)]|nr:hypothetical protein H8356DRAFT_1421554 [Neocallimastix sp. JGI-2020a]
MVLSKTNYFLEGWTLGPLVSPLSILDLIGFFAMPFQCRRRSLTKNNMKDIPSKFYKLTYSNIIVATAHLRHYETVSDMMERKYYKEITKCVNEYQKYSSKVSLQNIKISPKNYCKINSSDLINLVKLNGDNNNNNDYNSELLDLKQETSIGNSFVLHDLLSCYSPDLRLRHYCNFLEDSCNNYSFSTNKWIYAHIQQIVIPSTTSDSKKISNEYTVIMIWFLYNYFKKIGVTSFRVFNENHIYKQDLQEKFTPNFIKHFNSLFDSVFVGMPTVVMSVDIEKIRQRRNSDTNLNDRFSEFQSLILQLVLNVEILSIREGISINDYQK